MIDLVERAMQINIHPNDYRHVSVLLRHQIETWRSQVDRVCITLDTHSSGGGHYKSIDYEYKLIETRSQLTSIMNDYNNIFIQEVDYSQSSLKEISDYFFGTDTIPEKAWNGSPIYAYLYGIYHAKSAVVLHLDGDMLFGGGSERWLAEAVDLLTARKDCVFVGPLPGPPRHDNAILGHGENWKGSSFISVNTDYSHGFLFNTVSTRIFVVSLPLLFERLGGKLPIIRPSFRQKLHAVLLGNPPQMRELEFTLSRAMQLSRLKRLDFLGSSEGMWSLHPPYRSERFFESLQQIVSQVKSGAVPESQRGHYDFVDDFFDFSEARMKRRRLVRWKGHAHEIFRRLSKNNSQF